MQHIIFAKEIPDACNTNLDVYSPHNSYFLSHLRNSEYLRHNLIAQDILAGMSSACNLTQILDARPHASLRCLRFLETRGWIYCWEINHGFFNIGSRTPVVPMSNCVLGASWRGSSNLKACFLAAWILDVLFHALNVSLR